MFQPKTCMKYSQEDIAYTLDFLGLCNIVIHVFNKKINCALKY